MSPTNEKLFQAATPIVVALIEHGLSKGTADAKQRTEDAAHAFVTLITAMRESLKSD